MNEIGSKIKELRIKRGATLKDLGNAVDFNYSNLSKIERGERKPTLELLEKLADFFDVDISYFFGTKQDEQDKSLQDVGVEWVTFSEEMREKNISIEELRALAETLAGIKNNRDDK